MATDQGTAEYILDTLNNLDDFSVRKMFGEYALYANGVVVALICDNQLYVKVLPESAELADYCELAPPYDGAKDHYLVEEHLLHQIENLPEILTSIGEARKHKTVTKKKPAVEKKFTPKKGFMEKTFSERVLELALTIPSGRVTTYGAITKACGGAYRQAQSITTILGRAYENGQKDIPFHRIVYSDGRVWSSPEYDKKRMTLYKKEGIEVDEKGRIKNFKEKLFTF
jgi:DNA transformation protein and related proteins